MKRILPLLAVIPVFFSFFINCYGAEEIAHGDVCGRYIYSKTEGVYTATLIDGKYQLVTSDGVEIIVDGFSNDEVLVVHEISKEESECYDWLNSCVGSAAGEFTAYDFYIITALGDRKSLPTGTAITMANALNNQAVLWVSYDGETSGLPTKKLDQDLVFGAANGGYYLSYQKAGVILPPTGDVFSQKTLLLIFSSAFAIIVLFALKTRQRLYQNR